MTEGLTRFPARLQILVLDARKGGRPVDVRIVDGVVTEIGDLQREARDHVVPARGGEVIAGLHDHHLHVLAAAAHRGSVSLRGLNLPAALEAIGQAAARVADGEWVRVVDYREGARDDAQEAAPDGALPASDAHRLGSLDRGMLDRVAPANPVRVQDATGGLWVLNSKALACVPAQLIASRTPGDAEVDVHGRSTGRFHRMDAELAAVWPEGSGDLRALGDDLIRMGVTGLTDATPTTDPARIRALTDAHARGDLPQDLQILADRKIMLSDHALPDFERLCEQISALHAEGRTVAIHTVTLESGFLACHALAIAGVLPGDRLEHAAITTPELVTMIADLGVTVVTQPGFIADRGEMYRRSLDPVEHEGIYRYRSLLDAGVQVAPSSDHPFGPLSPWAGVRAAVDRTTEAGVPLAEHEAVGPYTVLAGYQSSLRNPGPRSRSASGPTVGSRADLCVLRAPLPDVIAGLRDSLQRGAGQEVQSPVAATLIGADVWQIDD